ncbi:MAG: glycoside hydrolase family 18 protein [Defluviitaleaceae bacterium]|nr:glycoside hydrolase family 18 protein [Defluviitaleaceae bacterium]
MSRLIGYVWSHTLSSMTETDIQSLDGINIAFGLVKDGEVSWEADKYIADLERIRKLNPQIKILLSVGGWGAGGFSDAAITETGRKKFAESAKQLVIQANLNGIDLDWEYPTNSAAGIDARDEDKQTFTLLLKEIRDALDTIPTADHLMLTIAAGAGSYYIEGTEMDKVAKLLDYVQIMTYDMADAHVKTTGHHTNLFNYANSTSSTKTAVDMFIDAGVPKEKLVIGAAFYSRKWDGVINEHNGYRQPAETIGDFGPTYGVLQKEYIDKNGFVRYWDEDAKAPYLFNGSSYISYDDEASIAHKIDYLKAQGLYGIMYWEHTCDTTQTLTQMIAKRLNKK